MRPGRAARRLGRMTEGGAARGEVVWTYTIVHAQQLAQSAGHPLRTGDAQGRWNSEGVPVSYVSEHPALAAMEVLNHLSPDKDLAGYRLFRIGVPAREIGDCPEDVNHHDEDEARGCGDAWARSGHCLALRVPSVAAPHSHNLLLNQEHPAFGALGHEDLGPFHFDPRVEERLRLALEAERG